MLNWKGTIMKEVFSENEILRQDIDDLPEMIKAALESSTQKEKLKFQKLKLSKGYLQGLKMIIMTGSSSSYNAAKAAAYGTELLCDIPTVAIHSQLMMNSVGIPTKDTLVIALSKSGEDSDTIFAAKRALKNGARVLAVAPQESTLYKMCKCVIPLSEYCESICSFNEQYFLLSLLSVYIGGKIGYMPKLNISVTLKLAEMLPGKLSFSPHGKKALEEAAEYMTSFSNIVFCGYASDEAIAREISEHFRAIGSISAYALPIYDIAASGIDKKDTLVVPIITNNANAALINMQLAQIKSIYDNALIFTTESIAQECGIKDGTVTVEDSIPLFNPIIITVALFKALSSTDDNTE